MSATNVSLRWLRLFDEYNFSRKALGILYRFSKTLLIDQPMDMLAVLVQHEIFGHGSRLREFDLKGRSYHIGLSFPYVRGSGWARFDPFQERRISKHEMITIHSAGSESNAVLSYLIRDRC